MRLNLTPSSLLARIKGSLALYSICLLTACAPFKASLLDFAQEQPILPEEQYKSFEDYEDESLNEKGSIDPDLPGDEASDESEPHLPHVPSNPPEIESTPHPHPAPPQPREPLPMDPVWPTDQNLPPRDPPTTQPTTAPNASPVPSVPPVPPQKAEPTPSTHQPAPTPPQIPHEPQEPRPSERERERDRERDRDSGTRAEGCEGSGSSPCFPVAGEARIHNDFGASRAGGRRRHAGNDIMAKKLVPVVAIDDGIVTRAKLNSGTAGNYLVIDHAKGIRSLYMHLNNDTPGTDDGRGVGIAPGVRVGGTVKKGQLIGWIGDSGNAEATPPHLHFELQVASDKSAARPKGFYPIDPNRMLKHTERFKVRWPIGYRYDEAR